MHIANTERSGHRSNNHRNARRMYSMHGGGHVEKVLLWASDASRMCCEVVHAVNDVPHLPRRNPVYVLLNDFLKKKCGSLTQIEQFRMSHTGLERLVKGIQDKQFGTDNGVDGNIALVIGTVVLMVIVGGQYLFRHALPYSDTNRIEGQKESSFRTMRRVRRFLDAMTVIFLVFLAAAQCNVMGEGAGKAGPKYILIAVGLVFFLFTSSLLGRLVGEPLGFGTCDQEDACSGLRDWVIFLLISFIIMHMLAKCPKLVISWVAGALVVMSVVCSVANITSHDKGSDAEWDEEGSSIKGFLYTDLCFDIAKMLIVGYFLYQIRAVISKTFRRTYDPISTKPPAGVDVSDTNPASAGEVDPLNPAENFGTDASSIF